MTTRMPRIHPGVALGRRPGGPGIGTLAAAAALAAAGCVNVPSPPADLASSELGALPARFADADPASQHAAPVANNWLAEFRDPTLLALADEAMLNNPDLRLAAARWEEAQARTRVARSFLLPDLSAAASAAREDSGGGSSVRNQYSVAAQAGWEVDLWGRLRADTRAARESEAATAFDYEFARQSLAAALADTWFLAIQARLQLAIDEDRLELERRTAQITRDRVEAGTGTQLDAELADANVSAAAATVQRDLAAIRELTRALETLLGRYPSAELAIASDLPPMPGPVAVGVPASLLERRPDIIAADRRVAAAFYNVESARAARLPQVFLTASLGSLIDPNETIWSIGADLLAPIFTGGRLQAQVEITTAQQRQALADYVAVAIAAFREVETALANEQFLARREAELEHASVRLRNASRIGEDRYNAGIMTIIELMVVRRQDFEIRTQLLQVRTDRLRQRLALYRALGGPFDQAPVVLAQEPPSPRTQEQSP